MLDETARGTCGGLLGLLRAPNPTSGEYAANRHPLFTLLRNVLHFLTAMEHVLARPPQLSAD
jgi:hypothetical protein